MKGERQEKLEESLFESQLSHTPTYISRYTTSEIYTNNKFFRRFCYLYGLLIIEELHFIIYCFGFNIFMIDVSLLYTQPFNPPSYSFHPLSLPSFFSYFMTSWFVPSRKARHCWGRVLLRTLREKALSAFKKLSGQGYRCGRKERGKPKVWVKQVPSVITWPGRVSNLPSLGGRQLSQKW